ncbi:MAG: hypothetical protein AB7I19_04825 [Planctomycetota bacterium]
MTPRAMLAVLGLVFLGVGGLLLAVGTHEPAPQAGLATVAGRLAGVEYRETAKLGRVCHLRLEANDEDFAVDHLEQMPVIAEQLDRSLRPGVAVELRCVPRERFEATGWASASKMPLNALELVISGERLFDAERDRPSGRFLTAAVFVAGLAALVFGVLLLVLALRSRPAS